MTVILPSYDSYESHNIDRWPDRKEGSQEKQRGSCDVVVETKKQVHLCKHSSYINLQ